MKILFDQGTPVPLRRHLHPHDADTALRFEQCFAVRAEWLMRLQAKHDYYKAYHEKSQNIKKEVKRLVVA